MDDAQRGWITSGFWLTLAVIVGALVGLYVAVFYGFPRFYEWMENRNFAKNRERSRLDCAQLPLHCAVRDDDQAAIERYIAAHGDLELRDGWGMTALYWALMGQKQKWMPLLLDAGADPNTQNDKQDSVLLLALQLKRVEVADALLAAGAEVDATIRDGTALHSCVRWNRVPCVRYLLDHGADPSIEFGNESVFEVARRHERDHLPIDPEIIELLRKKQEARAQVQPGASRSIP